MNSCLSASLLIFGLNIFVAKGENSTQGSEHLLYRRLFHDYTPDSRPVKNASKSVTITFALGLNQLLDLDEKNQVLSTSVWIYEEWTDELLKWSPEEFDGREMLMIPATTIWLPDIFIFNAAGETADGFVSVNGSKVSVRSDGRISWMVPLMIKSACPVDVTYFPYDRQTCCIKFISWIYDMAQVNIVIDSSMPDMDQYVKNSEYDLENVSISRGVLDGTCCPGEGHHPMVELKIQLKRKSLFYDYIVIAPTIMLCVLTLVSFLLPCDKGEKIAIGLNVFLTLYVLQLRIADNVPDTNSTPILGVFMLVVMTFNCVSLIMATLVMNIKKRGDTSRCSDVPSWLFRLCDKGLGRIVCTLWNKTSYIPLSIPEQVVEQETAFDGPDERETTQYNDDIVQSDVKDRPFIPGMVKRESLNLSHGNKKMRNYSLDDQLFERDTNDSVSVSSPSFINLKCRRGHSLRRKLLLRSKSASISSDDDCVRRRNQSDTGRTSIDQDVCVNERSLPWRAGDVTSLERLRRVNLYKRRWFYVAEVVDKFAFLVYLVLLTICIFTVLYLIPVHFRND